MRAHARVPPCGAVSPSWVQAVGVSSQSLQRSQTVTLAVPPRPLAFPSTADRDSHTLHWRRTLEWMDEWREEEEAAGHEPSQKCQTTAQKRNQEDKGNR